jgi:CheY-like chemotaxis protein/HPt (histidine-containing phosphotransfer) domain-containing protein
LIGDELRLGQILKNIGYNAVKFTQHGEINAEICCIALEGKSIKLKCCIQDSGIGIMPEQQNKLFKNFSQVDTGLSRNYEGSGLGLVISKKLVEMMNGEIWLDSSESGVGSTFCFTAELEVADDQERIINNEYKESSTFLSDQKLLLVDDDEEARVILTKTAESIGITSVIAGNCKEAVGILENNTIDVVMIDCKVQQMDNIETAKTLIQGAKVKHKPKIIVVTALNREGVLDKIIDQGLDGLIVKPVSPSTLLDTFLRVLGTTYYKNTVSKHERFSLESIRGANILVVEDNDINREFAKEMLLGEALHVDEAVDGLDAIEKVKKNRYDAILMDIQMPSLDGIEATKRIRKLSNQLNDIYYDKVPIIALSANALKSDVERSLASGFDAYVKKPVIPEQLFRVMLKHIKLSANHRATNEIYNSVNEKVINKTKEFEYDFSLLRGVNVDEALKRLVNNKSLFSRLLRQFYDQYRNKLTQIIELIDSNKYDEAEKSCHMIKGVVANLGAESLFKNLDSVDALLKQNKRPDKEAILSASNEFNEFLLGIEEFLQSGLDIEQKKQYEEIDFIRAIDVFQFMQSKLDADFKSCIKIFKKYKNQYLHIIDGDKLTALEDAIDHLEIEEVKQLLSEILKMLKTKVVV